jgi:hypothetical protein
LCTCLTLFSNTRYVKDVLYGFSLLIHALWSRLAIIIA